MKKKRAVIIHRLTQSRLFEVPRQAGENLRDTNTLARSRRDFHRVYYGWVRGLQNAGWDIKFIDQPSFLLPQFLLYMFPDAYIYWYKVLHLNPYHKILRWFKKLDTLLCHAYLLLLILAFKPDFILGHYDALPEALRALCKQRNITTISYFGVIPQMQTEEIKQKVLAYDYILSGYDLPSLWPESSGKVYRILLGASEVSDYIPPTDTQKDLDVTIIGRFDDNHFRTRSTMINQLIPMLNAKGIQLHAFGYDMGGQVAQNYPALSQILQPPIYGQAFYQTLKRSKILLSIPLNAHIQANITRPQGIMEPPAVKSFQLAYDTQDTRSIFEPGKEIVVFRDLNDLFEKICYYLAHPEERERIAQNAHNRFWQEYTGEKQIIKMVEHLNLDNSE